MDVERLRRRKDFVRLSAEGHKFVTSCFIMLAAPSGEESTGPARVGFTVTKKIGNSPERNRIRRRLREAIRMAEPDLPRAAWDYVLIARKQALLCPFPEVLRDIRFAFPRVGKVKPRPNPRHDTEKPSRSTLRTSDARTPLTK
jgi:ribonuclease P protein component